MSNLRDPDALYIRFALEPALAEEFQVLLLDRERGGLVNTNNRNMRYAFANPSNSLFHLTSIIVRVRTFAPACKR